MHIVHCDNTVKLLDCELRITEGAERWDLPADVPALFVEILILFKAIERDEVTVAVPKFRANFHRALKCEISDTYFQNCSY